MKHPSTVCMAAAQFPVSEPLHWDVMAATIGDWVAHAAAEGAQLLVFPEYAAMSLAAIFGAEIRNNLGLQLRALQGLHPRWLSLHNQLAQRHGVHILAGSFPVAEGSEYRNRAHLFAPNGHCGFQDKWTMTRFETEQWGIHAGRVLKVFDTNLGRMAVNICYDVEFPLLARAQVQAGATILLTPSCTDTAAGYWRVRIGAQARALENQCVVIQAPLVGTAPWSAAIDVNVGAAGVYAPPDRGLPDEGVLAKGAWNVPQWLYASVEPAKLAAVRTSGQVLNHRDWAQQPGLGAMPVVVVESLI